jgi:hypothetical protein
MPKYMLLLCRQEREETEFERPLGIEFNESLRDAGLLLGGDPLCPVDAATTVRVRSDETEILDGPFAGDQGVSGWLLPPRVRRSRRGAQAGRTCASGPLRIG